MKKIVLLAALVICSFAASAQSSISTTSEQLTKSKASGTYVFVLPADVTSEKVDQLKAYYVNHFTTTFDEKSHEVKFTMVSNEWNNRRIMQRFMAGAGVQTFNVDGTQLRMDEAFDKYIHE